MSRKEVSSFIDKYLPNRVFTIRNDEKNINLLKIILKNAVDFERPDGYSLVNNDCYIIGHFEFDPYVQKKE